MAACFHAGEHDRGRALFDEMRLSPSPSDESGRRKASPPKAHASVASVAPTPATRSTAATTVPGGARGATEGRPRGARRGAVGATGGQAVSARPQPDAASYNTVIAAVAATARGAEGLEEAMALVVEMRVRGCRLARFVFSGVLLLSTCRSNRRFLLLLYMAI